MIILICLTLVYIWSQKFREDKNITSLYIPGQNLSQRKAEFNLYETGKPWILSNTDVRVYILKHSISARHSLWKSLRTSVEVVYTKYASKMTTCKEKTKVQTRKKKLPCQISFTITGCTVVILWQRPSQMNRQHLTSKRSEIPHLKNI